jgi:hypothetical protein
MHDRVGSLATFAVLMFVILANTTTSPIARAQGAQRDPVLGTWKMNPAKSKFNPGPAPRSVVRTYVAAGDGVKVTVEGLDALDTRNKYEYTAKYDGNDYPITGTAVPGGGDSIALTRIDALTVNEVLKKGGKPIYTATRTVSKDGKLLTFMSSGTNTSGKQTNNVTVYERQ